jgi:predicted RNA-binding protein associated with RNAse of E/G family
MKTIKLRFVRLPDIINVWTHELIRQDEKIIVSRFKFEDLKGPYSIKGRLVVKNGYTGVCYDFLDKGYEIIKVLDMEDKLTGYYCNINKYPKVHEGWYEVVDLFLDIWVFPDMNYVVLDEDEFEDAFKKGVIKEDEKKFAEKNLGDIIRILETKKFPPKIMSEIG